MLMTANLSQRFFPEAALYAVHIYNNNPSQLLNFKSPSMIALGYERKLERMSIFGSDTFVKLADQQSKAGKFESKIKQGIFMGRSDNQLSDKILLENYKFINSRNTKIINGRFEHVKQLYYLPVFRSEFHIDNLHYEDEDDDDFIYIQNSIQPTATPIESTFIEQMEEIKENEQEQPIQVEEQEIIDQEDFQMEYESPEQIDRTLYDISEESSQHTSPESQLESIQSIEPTPSITENIITQLPSTEPNISRSGRIRTTTSRYGQINPMDLDPTSRFQVFGFLNIEGGDKTILQRQIIIPKTLTEALKGNEKTQWLEATNQEMIQMIKSDSFELVENPDTINKKPIPTRLLY
jgi:hypothetical protein